MRQVVEESVKVGVSREDVICGFLGLIRLQLGH